MYFYKESILIQLNIWKNIKATKNKIHKKQNSEQPPEWPEGFDTRTDKLAQNPQKSFEYLLWFV